ncbi:phospholipase D family protein [Lacibacterium aquatile]|uniref:Phospholipase D family protein n=1 Tax=Lacibacterium aquatile TaxID=1168082 RepID=A0ABW5DNM7_9PROT
MLRILGGGEVSEEFRKMIFSGSDIYCAVAFWGKGVANLLGLDALRPGQSATIICDLLSGGCNPREILFLMNCPGVKVLHLPGLHAKVYMTQHQAILGSSNASANGLSLVAGPQIEANILSVDKAFLRDARRWFDRVKQFAQEVSEADIAQACSLWRRRAATPKGLYNRALPTSGGFCSLTRLPVRTESLFRDQATPSRRGRGWPNAPPGDFLQTLSRGLRACQADTARISAACVRP